MSYKNSVRGIYHNPFHDLTCGHGAKFRVQKLHFMSSIEQRATD